MNCRDRNLIESSCIHLIVSSDRSIFHSHSGSSSRLSWLVGWLLLVWVLLLIRLLICWLWLLICWLWLLIWWWLLIVRLLIVRLLIGLMLLLGWVSRRLLLWLRGSSLNFIQFRNHYRTWRITNRIVHLFYNGHIRNIKSTKTNQELIKNDLSRTLRLEIMWTIVFLRISPLSIF